ncbi:MAG: YfcE family phosphodiesterase [Proteobacteria bacterium]|nr:YfcE family phosphodiesterase [Desulfobulbaceae bacterium]MBU4154277.1 YfcE family phosphodiesterase [Pseudomonadota bacterium]
MTVGILSDTHLSRLTPEFEARAETCFADCSVILHAGDLTDLTILKAFTNREVHAVHGNMCSFVCHKALPEKKVLRYRNFTVGLIHRAGNTYDFEDQLIDQFEDVDCIIYGHTHHPVCHHHSGILFINPGSFQATGRHGHPGTYAILKIGDTLRATIHEVPV